jgi:DNA helicase-2/ATP-dependent DNA helicase PcrA
MVFLPVVLGLKPKSFDRVLIDETQDLSRAQVELALMACRKGGRITAVGDTRQAIYQFRGADSRSIPNLIKRLDATVLPLSVTYRCARSIVAHVREIVPQIEASPSAPEGVVREDVSAATMLRDWRAGDFVLSRTNAPLVRLCLRALRQGVPAFVLGRDVGAGLRALVAKFKGTSPIGLVSFARTWRDGEHKRLRAAFGKPAGVPGGAPLKKSEADKLDAVTDRFETICALAEDVPTVAALLAKLGVLFDEVSRAPRLMFSSTHKAKGMETPRVWMLRGTYRRGAGEEEDNLYYVAATRAERELNLVDYDPSRADDR